MNTYGHEEIYRGQKVFKLMDSQSFTVCGCGAIGSNLIDNMVRQGFKKISVIDQDRIEDHNRHTQIWGKRDIGQLKANMIQRYISFNMGVRVNSIPKRLEKSSCKRFLAKEDIIIDSFDNSESRGIVTEHCADNKIECLHVGLFQDYAEVLWNEKYRVPKDTQDLDVCEYPLARNVIILAVSVATEVLIRYLETGKKENYIITLKDFKITPA